MHDLVRALLRHLDAPHPGTNAEGGPEAEEILMDLDIDQCRYLLVRLPRPERTRAGTLSPREYEIARMVGDGLPSKTIASVLNISSWTVGTHVRRIFAKLGVNTRAAMVAKLRDAGVAGALSAGAAHAPHATSPRDRRAAEAGSTTRQPARRMPA